MNIDEFIDLIKENSAKNQPTEFMKIEFSIDDPRKDKPAGLEVSETFSVKYDKVFDTFLVNYPDEDRDVVLSSDDIDEIFYAQRWGTCVHK